MSCAQNRKINRRITRVGTYEVCFRTHVALGMFIMQVLASQLHFLANKNAGLAIPPLFWPVNCIKIGDMLHCQDLFQIGQQQFLIIVGYWSGFSEVQELTKVTSKSIINASKVQFARHGIPKTVISENGPQFSSAEFHQFTKEWQFQH